MALASVRTQTQLLSPLLRSESSKRDCLKYSSLDAVQPQGAGDQQNCYDHQDPCV